MELNNLLPEDKKLSWSETFKAMADMEEDWSEWSLVEEDGLQEIPFEDN